MLSGEFDDGLHEKKIAGQLPVVAGWYIPPGGLHWNGNESNLQPIPFARGKRYDAGNAPDGDFVFCCHNRQPHDRYSEKFAVHYFIACSNDDPGGIVCPICEPDGGCSQDPGVSVDGMVMVYVPAGEFLMGSLDGEGNKDERPQHSIYLDAFWIDQTEVTNAMYARCVSAGACTAPASQKSYTRSGYFGNADFADYPVIFVNWGQAQKYCQWAGRRLPSEAEWEKAARGTQGQIYPWGNAAPTDRLANFNGTVGDTSRVGSYPAGASPYGALDMAGNVAEWVADWYAEYPTYTFTITDPLGPESGSYRILRGGSWIFSDFMIRSAQRYWASAFYVDDDAGFRCATSP